MANTAWRFFKDPELTSNITGIDKWSIGKFSTILQAVASGKKIDVLKFEQYFQKTVVLNVSLYDWFYISVTVYMILEHGTKVIEAASLWAN